MASCTELTASPHLVETIDRPSMTARTSDGTSPTAARPSTTLDLCDDWAPRLFTPPDRETPAYRNVFVALANERFDAPHVPSSARADRYFELYGIPPSPSVILSRLTDEKRYACHAAVDDMPLLGLQKVLVPGRQRDEHRRAVLAAQEHLVCEGLLLPSQRDGVFHREMKRALQAYQRRHVVLGKGTLDAQTRATLLTDSRELDVRAALRMLRERVVDATGLLEDGTAAGESQPVLDRLLDPPQLLSVRGRTPVSLAAPDRVAEATQAAAVELGWTDADAIEQWLAAPRASCRVEVTLPEPPAWQRHPHELRVEIDRGDVQKWGRRGAIKHRPTLTVYVSYDGREEALVRWPTTIGGWNDEQMEDGLVVRRYKESPTGSFVWRDVVAAPTWLPPKSTPDAELVRRYGRRFRVKNDIIGPGYRSAYGLAMMMHVKEIPARGDRPPAWFDEAVRTHGSANYRSVYGGTSHGCHRLPNHLALRLSSFVVRHVPHEVLGNMATNYGRSLLGGLLHIARDSRGFGYRLERPVRVDVLEGNVQGASRGYASRRSGSEGVGQLRPSSDRRAPRTG